MSSLRAGSDRVLASREGAAASDEELRQPQLQTDGLLAAEAQIRELRRAADRFYDEAPIAYVTINRAQVVTSVNQTAEAVVGPGELLLGRSLSTLTGPGTLPAALGGAGGARRLAWLDEHLTALAPGAERRLSAAELHLQPEAGRTLVFRVPSIGRLLPPEDQRYRLALIDVTALRRTENELREREARLSAVLDTTADGMISVAPNATIETANVAAGRLFLIPPRHLIGRLVERVLPGIAPLLEREAPVTSYHTLGRRIDGTLVPVEVSSGRLRAGREPRWVLMFRDVTERLTQERALSASVERFSAIAEQIDELFYVIERNETTSQCVYASPAFERVFRRTLDSTAQPMPDAASPPWMTWVVDEDREVLRKLHAQAWRGEAARSWYQIRCPDGTLRRLHERVYPTGAPGTRQLTGIVEDVTAAHRMEQELRQAQRLEALGTLTSGISHDFNNLLMGISGAVELALNFLDDDHPARRPLERAGQAVDWGSSLARRLVSLSDMRPNVSAPVVEVDPLLQAVAEMLPRLLGEHIRLEVSLGCAGLRCRAEAAELEQMLLNLATNARDAMPLGGSLTIATIRLHDGAGEDQVQITVRDTGHGMDATTLEHVFDPFFTTKPVGSGTGLGLPSVLAVVRRLDGHIDVQSAPGLGTTFTLRLPVSQTEAAAAADPPRSRQQEIGWGGETVLLVEDDDLVRETVRSQLDSLGYRVVEAAAPAQALELGHQLDTLDVLLTDVMMPDRLGSTLAAELRERFKDMRVLFMSGHPASEHHRAGRLSAGDQLLGKPFNKTALAAELRRLLQDEPPSSHARPSRRRRRSLTAPRGTSARSPATRVLIVDDQHDAVELLAEALSMQGHEVATARNAGEALVQARRLRPEVVLCDLNLGDSPNGYQVARALRAEEATRHAALVAVTGFESDRCLESARAAGFDSVLSKPVSLAQIESLLRGHTRR